MGQFMDRFMGWLMDRFMVLIHGSDPNLDSDLGSDLSDPLLAVSSPRLSVQHISLGSRIHRELGFTTAM
jgi:hypothetical protein